MIENIRILHETFWGTSIYWIIYLVCLVLLFGFRKKMKRGYQILGWYSIMVCCGIIYNPIFMKVAYKLFFRGIAEYIRIFMILPVWIVIAYVMTECIQYSKKKLVRFASLIVCILVLILSGVPFSKTGMYVEAENPYKIDQEALEIANILLEDSGGEARILIQTTADSYRDRATWYHGMRQYSSDIIFVGRFLTDEEYAASDMQSMRDYINELKKDYEFQYVICENGTLGLDGLLEYGGEILVEIEGHVVLKLN